MIRIVAAVLFTVAVGGTAQAQIPNAGFETWVNSTTLANWTSNNTGLYTTVTQSPDKHSGSFAVQGQVVDYVGVPIPPFIISLRFPVSERHGSLSGYYKFIPVGGDRIGAVITMYKNSSLIGGGGGEDGTGYASYTQVSLPIDYFDGTTVPDSAQIEIIISPDSVSGDLHVGSTLFVDDLSLGGPTAVDDLPGFPTVYQLGQNYPNPFNPTTSIGFTLPRESYVKLTVFNMLGQEVATLANGILPAGDRSAEWNASAVVSGIYFYRLEATGVSDPSKRYTSVRKMVLMR
jgi:hypothetical protein